jgi:hypothetical protein
MSDDTWGAGDPAKWSDHGTVLVGDCEYPLIYGEHPHSRSDNRHYVKLSDKEPVGFAGHRPLISVTLESRNYLKSSHYSGDEIRKGGSGKIISDGEVVWEFFFRDVQWGLLEAHRLISQLSEHSSFWLMKRERDGLVGRAIYYREIPAVIHRTIVDQGCVMIGTADGQPFPPAVYENEEDDEKEAVIKDSVLSPHIWWHREAKDKGPI